MQFDKCIQYLYNLKSLGALKATCSYSFYHNSASNSSHHAPAAAFLICLRMNSHSSLYNLAGMVLHHTVGNQNAITKIALCRLVHLFCVHNMDLWATSAHSLAFLLVCLIVLSRVSCMGQKKGHLRVWRLVLNNRSKLLMWSVTQHRYFI